MAAKNLTPTERRHIRIIRALLDQYELFGGAANVASALQREVDEFVGHAAEAERQRREEQDARVRADLAKFGEALANTKPGESK